MSQRNWKRVRATSFRQAIELCKDHAREVRRIKVERIAELMGLPDHFALYKWIQTGRIPGILIRPFEHACGCTFITDFLGASAHKLVIDIPTGKRANDIDIAELQARLSEAMSSLIRFYQGGANAEETEATLTGVMADLAFHRENVHRAAQPELQLEFGHE